jgi:hypothetical protein
MERRSGYITAYVLRLENREPLSRYDLLCRPLPQQLPKTSDALHADLALQSMPDSAWDSPYSDK